MKKKYITNAAILLSFALGTYTLTYCSKSHAALPVWGAEIAGRDLNAPGMTWAGHVGVTWAEYMGQPTVWIIEALNEAPVLQANYIGYFSVRSFYWGSRYGIGDDAYYSWLVTRFANFQRNLGCAQYSFLPKYGYGTVDTWGNRVTCGYYRCDSFVSASFGYAGYQSPHYKLEHQVSASLLPVTIFNWFPKSNEDAYPRSIIPEYSQGVSFGQLTFDEIKSMSTKELYDSMLISSDTLTHDDIKKLSEYVKRSDIDPEKRKMLVDYLGLEANFKSIKTLIELYQTLDPIKDAEVYNRILPDIQILYEKNNINKHPNEAKILNNFFMEILDNTTEHKDIVIRGILNMNSKNMDIKLAKRLLGTMDYNMLAVQSINLKMQLMFACKEYQKAVALNIINILDNTKDADIANIVNSRLVGYLGNIGLNIINDETKIILSDYLLSRKAEFTQINMLSNNPFMSLDSALWLEAYALLVSKTHTEASEYIASFVKTVPVEHQKIYLMGLSTADYIKKAFKTNDFLRDFKEKNKNIFPPQGFKPIQGVSL